MGWFRAAAPVCGLSHHLDFPSPPSPAGIDCVDGPISELAMNIAGRAYCIVLPPNRLPIPDVVGGVDTLGTVDDPIVEAGGEAVDETGVALGLAEAVGAIGSVGGVIAGFGVGVG